MYLLAVEQWQQLVVVIVVVVFATVPRKLLALEVSSVATEHESAHLNGSAGDLLPTMLPGFQEIKFNLWT